MEEEREEDGGGEKLPGKDSHIFYLHDCLTSFDEVEARKYMKGGR